MSADYTRPDVEPYWEPNSLCLDAAVRCDTCGLRVRVVTLEPLRVEPCVVCVGEGVMKSCHECKRPLAVGESAWADDWTVVTPEGPRMEVRYTCDDCEACR